MSREDTIKELIQHDPTYIIPRWSHKIGTAHDGGVIPSHGHCDAGLHEDLSVPCKPPTVHLQYLGVDVSEVILWSDKTGEEEGSILEWDEDQLLWTLRLGVWSIVSWRVRHALVRVRI